MTTEEKILDSQQIALPLPDSIGITQSSGLDHHAVFNRQRVDQFVEQDVASTESARQHKDATDLICQPDTEQRQLIRRLTPLECERLQGFPDGWRYPRRVGQRLLQGAGQQRGNPMRDLRSARHRRRTERDGQWVICFT